nr:EAL domain-containing protein [Caballeronia zhejiangensis]
MQVRSRRWLQRAVAYGLAHDQFRVHYQPIIDIKTEQIVGFEALARWFHPLLGEIRPDEFIRALEKTHLLTSLMDFMLGRVLEEISKLEGGRVFRICINVDPADLARPRVVDMLISAASLMPRNVTMTLEFTERGELLDSAFTIKSLGRIRRAGIKLAIDDFGTARSNIDLLQRVRFDFLKIDRRYIAQLGEGGWALFRTIVDIARHFDLIVVAEGVETPFQHAMLISAEVELGQGYLYGRPASATDWFGASVSSVMMPSSEILFSPLRHEFG